MKVARVEAIPVAYPEPNDSDSTRHLLFVKVTGDDGQIVWGEAVTMWPEATLATGNLVDGLAALVSGTDQADLAHTYAALQAHTWWYGNGGIASFALAAIDIALWDLAGKAAHQSVMELIGHRAHGSVPVLVSCHAMHADLDEIAATMASWVAQHQAVGIKVAYGKRCDADLGTRRPR